MSNNQDIFKLVEEVERQKRNSVDDIFGMLDDVNSSTVEEIKNSINQRPSYPNDTVTVTRSQVVIKPSVPTDPVDFSTMFDCLKHYVEHISYGENNATEYVNGHKDAIEKYYSDCFNNRTDMYLVEVRINEEIVRFGDKSDLYKKGYYDGLYFMFKAIKRAKELSVVKIAKDLNGALK